MRPWNPKCTFIFLTILRGSQCGSSIFQVLILKGIWQFHSSMTQICQFRNLGTKRNVGRLDPLLKGDQFTASKGDQFTASKDTQFTRQKIPSLGSWGPFKTQSKTRSPSKQLQPETHHRPPSSVKKMDAACFGTLLWIRKVPRPSKRNCAILLRKRNLFKIRTCPRPWPDFYFSYEGGGGV